MCCVRFLGHHCETERRLESEELLDDGDSHLDVNRMPGVQPLQTGDGFPLARLTPAYSKLVQDDEATVSMQGDMCRHHVQCPPVTRCTVVEDVDLLDAMLQQGCEDLL